jgi:phosphate transport system substrate-binding protein
MTSARIYSFFMIMLGLLALPLRAEPLNLVGTGDGFDVFQALAQAYAQTSPGAQVLVPRSIGSGGAIAAVGAGRERIGRIARALAPVEVASGLVTLPVFDIPSAFYVHPSVPVRQLTSDQLRGIFEGKITNWSMLGGPDLRIRVVRREEADSTLMALRAGLPAFRDIVMSERSKLALTTQDAISSVRDNEGAIGFAPYSEDTATLLGVVALNGHLPASPGYPAKVQVTLLWRDGQRDRDIDAFVAFLASPEARRVITRLGAIPSEK